MRQSVRDVAKQLLRAIRGRRSQVAFARRLGYRGNPVAKWEGGHRYPTAAEALRAAAAAGIDVEAALRAFHPAPWAPDRDGEWLSALKGDASQGELAARSGLSRQAVGRALRGDSRPRLPEWLALVEAATGRVADLVSLLVDIREVPALAQQADLQRSVRRLVSTEPWAPAVLALVDTLPGGPDTPALPSLLSASLGLGESEAARVLETVRRSGALSREASGSAPTIDTARLGAGAPAPRSDTARRGLRAHWAAVSAERIAAGRDDDVFSYNVFAVSRRDLARIRELQRRFFRAVRGIVSRSEPEVAAFLTIHTGALAPV